jgi:hypothetical protein
MDDWFTGLLDYASADCRAQRPSIRGKFRPSRNRVAEWHVACVLLIHSPLHVCGHPSHPPLLVPF